ncbi:hypothetical protein HK102_008697, partial [Quaeritorhiza haematococci]
FAHPSPAAIAAAGGTAAGLGGGIPLSPAGAAQSPRPRCAYGMHCRNPACTFYHPKAVTVSSSVPFGGSSSTSGQKEQSATNGSGKPAEEAKEGDASNPSTSTAPTPTTAAYTSGNPAVTPCRFEPFCNRPNCPYLHTGSKASSPSPAGSGFSYGKRGLNKSVIFNNPAGGAGGVGAAAGRGAGRIMNRSFAVSDSDVEEKIAPAGGGSGATLASITAAARARSARGLVDIARTDSFGSSSAASSSSATGGIGEELDAANVGVMFD